MSDSSTHTVQLQYVTQQYTHSTTTFCQTAVHTKYDYTMSHSSTETVQLEFVRHQYTYSTTTVCETAVHTQ
jgi:hypothetical protein